MALVPASSRDTVSSVFARTGAVTAQTGDYTAAQVGAVAAGAAAGGSLAGTYPNPTLANLPQAAIADVPTGTLVLLSDVITAIGQIRTALNTLLAELRTAGVLLP